MTHIKLIATDLDGTLLNNAHQLTPGTERALKAAMRLGVQVIVATGKTPGGSIGPVRQLGLTTPGVYSQGLVLLNTDGSIRAQIEMDRATARAVAVFAETRGFPLAAYSGADILAARRSTLTEFMMAHQEPEPRWMDPLSAAIETRPINKLVMQVPPEEMAAIRAALAAHVDGQAALVPSMPHILEVMPPGRSKGEGVARLLAELGIDPQDVIAFGDAENDIEMLQMAGIGVAMGNASPVVKGAADFVTASNEEDGVARAVERFILQKAKGWPDEPPPGVG